MIFPFSLGFLLLFCPYSVISQYGSSVLDIINDQQIKQYSPVSNENNLVGNLSESFTFQVAPPSVKVTYLGLNGLSLYIMGVGFSNKSKFNYDEQNNRLTILSLDSTTVGLYSAVDDHWKTFTNIISAINVSSIEIHNSHVTEDNNGSSLVSCSVSIICSTFKLTESKSFPTENLPRLDLFLSTREIPSIYSEKKISNDTINGQNFTRIVTLQRPLTRADHNGTLQCQIESNINNEIYLKKTVRIDIEYGPNLEAGASEKVNLESDALKMIAMECQVEANPNPSYVWYEMINNQTNGLSVFGTTRQIQRIYQYSGHFAMQCQAQARGKTVKQEFFINVLPQSNAMKIRSDIDNTEKSNKIPIIIGICVGSLLLLLALAIIIATIIHLKRRNIDSDKKTSTSTDKLSNDKQNKPRWGNLQVDYSKYKNEASSSTSHLVESAETNSIQAPPPVPARPSPMTSTHSSYRQAPSTSVSLSYRQASALPGFRLPPPPITRTYSPEQDDEISINMNAIPMTNNRLRTKSPFGSHKSLSESVQSLKSNQQPSISLPTKKRSNDQAIKSSDIKTDYQHHHYQNPIELRMKSDNTSSEEEEEEFEQPTNLPPITISSEYNQVDFPQQSKRRNLPPLSPSKLIILPDELPPSYQQVSNTSSPSHAYIYQEPTEV